MLLAETFVGNLDDPDVAERVDGADAVLRIDVDDDQRRRSRFRTTAAGGRDVGVVSGRTLDDGDVLAGEDALVVVRLESVDALVLDFEGADVSPATAMEVGHAIGNRHWDLAVRGDEVVLPLVEDRERMEAAVGPLRASGVRMRTEGVPAATFDDGGTGGVSRSPAHTHSPTDAHSRPHSHDEEHDQANVHHHDATEAHDTD